MEQKDAEWLLPRPYLTLPFCGQILWEKVAFVLLKNPKVTKVCYLVAV